MKLPSWLAAPVRRNLLDDLAQPGSHEAETSAMFGGRMAAGEQRSDCRLTVMAFTNRCGSNLLADYLVQTGRFGGFGEALNPPVVKAFAEREAVRSLPDYLLALAERQNCGPDKDLGVKASADQLAMLLRHGLPNMFAGFRVIHIWRQDLLGQAVSFEIASHTNRWTTRQKAASKAVDDIAFDPVRIDQMMRAIQAHNSRIAATISVLGIESMSLSYEELTAAPGASVRRICAGLSFDLAGWKPRAPKIEKQADALNDRLVSQYRAIAQARLLAT